MITLKQNYNFSIYESNYNVYDFDNQCVFIKFI